MKQPYILKNRVRVPGGFGHRSLQGIDPGEYAVMGFVKIDGKPALFGAMPVMPDEFQVTLPDGPANRLCFPRITLTTSCCVSSTDN